MSASGDVMFVGDNDNRVAFLVQALEEVHDFHAGVCIQGACRFICEQD